MLIGMVLVLKRFQGGKTQQQGDSQKCMNCNTQTQEQSLKQTHVKFQCPQLQKFAFYENNRFLPLTVCYSIVLLYCRVFTDSGKEITPDCEDF